MTEAIDLFLRDYEKHLHRAYFYEEKENYQQALQEYRSVLVNYELAVREIKRCSVTQSDDELISFLFCFGRLTNSVANAYYKISNKNKALFFAKRLREIFEALSPYQGSFEVAKIKEYEEFAECLKFIETVTSSAKELQPEDLSDETFKKISEKINSIRQVHIDILSPKESSSSGSCFIATAAYSTSIHPDLDTFRNFRDKKLLTNPVGKQLVNLYYRISPIIAQYVEKQPGIKNLLRHQLGRLAEWMRSQRITSK